MLATYDKRTFAAIFVVFFHQHLIADVPFWMLVTCFWFQKPDLVERKAQMHAKLLPM